MLDVLDLDLFRGTLSLMASIRTLTEREVLDKIGEKVRY